MEWTKIKAKYFLYSDLTLLDRGVLSTILLLTAHLERVPTPTEIARHIPARSLQHLREGLATPLPEVLERVLEDVSTITHKRSVSKETSRKHRSKENGDVSPSLSRDTTDKIREDKRREDKKVDVSHFVSIWDKYPRKDGKKEALRHYRSSVKTDESRKNIEIALTNYLNHIKRERTEDKYIKKGSTWFNDWEDWIECQDKKKGTYYKISDVVR